MEGLHSNMNEIASHRHGAHATRSYDRQQTIDYPRAEELHLVDYTSGRVPVHRTHDANHMLRTTRTYSQSVVLNQDATNTIVLSIYILDVFSPSSMIE
jgi:hypothetical protein